MKRIPCIITRMDGNQEEEFVQLQLNGMPWVIINLGEEIEQGVPEWALNSLKKKEFILLDSKGNIRKGYPKKLYKIDYLDETHAPEPTEEERLKKLSRGELIAEYKKATDKDHKEIRKMKNSDLIDGLK